MPYLRRLLPRFGAFDGWMESATHLKCTVVPQRGRIAVHGQVDRGTISERALELYAVFRRTFGAADYLRRSLIVRTCTR